MSVLPVKRILTTVQVYQLLSRRVAEDAIAAGWLKPCAEKPCPRGPARKLWSREDVSRVEDRILGGEYPTTKK